METSRAMKLDWVATARTLSEALPYLQRYDDKVVVIKFGGHAMGDDDAMARFARDVTLLATGSEVSLALCAAEGLAKDGIAAQVVSMPCWELFDEQDAAVKWMIRNVIEEAHTAGAKVGLCGQAPSNDPEYARILVKAGIDSISVTPDSFLAVKQHVAAAEKD